MPVSGNQKVRRGWSPLRVPLGTLTGKIPKSLLKITITGLFQVDFSKTGTFEVNLAKDGNFEVNRSVTGEFESGE